MGHGWSGRALLCGVGGRELVRRLGVSSRANVQQDRVAPWILEGDDVPGLRVVDACIIEPSDDGGARLRAGQLDHVEPQARRAGGRGAGAATVPRVHTNVMMVATC